MGSMYNLYHTHTEDRDQMEDNFSPLYHSNQHDSQEVWDWLYGTISEHNNNAFLL